MISSLYSSESFEGFLVTVANSKERDGDDIVSGGPLYILKKYRAVLPIHWTYHWGRLVYSSKFVPKLFRGGFQSRPMGIACPAADNTVLRPFSLDDLKTSLPQTAEHH